MMETKLPCRSRGQTVEQSPAAATAAAAPTTYLLRPAGYEPPSLVPTRHCLAGWVSSAPAATPSCGTSPTCRWVLPGRQGLLLLQPYEAAVDQTCC